MPGLRGINLPSGHKWCVASCLSSDASILIPVDQMEGLSDEEIGRIARSLIREARLLFAEEQADRYLRFFPGGYQPGELEADKRLFQEFADASPDVHRALAAIEEFEERQERRALAKATKRKKRAQVAARYHRTFVAVGRRDGFKCAKCGSGEDLELDHIVPLADGGDNDLDNFQLLCGTCNRAKGDTTADYRSRDGATS